MNIYEIILLAIGLAMDCFSVSIAYSAVIRKVKWSLWLKIGIFFGGFQALMPVIGWLLASTCSHYILRYDHWVAFGLLTYLGVKMIMEGSEDDNAQSLHLEHFKELLVFSVATSIDALAIGISFAFVGFETFNSIVIPIFIIGVVSLVFSVFGCFMGTCIGNKFKTQRVEIVGGIVLIAIGLKVLIEHLFF